MIAMSQAQTKGRQSIISQDFVMDVRNSICVQGVTAAKDHSKLERERTFLSRFKVVYYLVSWTPVELFYDFSLVCQFWTKAISVMIRF